MVNSGSIPLVTTNNKYYTIMSKFYFRGFKAAVTNYVKSKSLIQVAMDVFAFGFLLPLAVVGWVSLVIHLIMNGIPGDVTFGIYG